MSWLATTVKLKGSRCELTKRSKVDDENNAKFQRFEHYLQSFFLHNCIKILHHKMFFSVRINIVIFNANISSL